MKKVLSLVLALAMVLGSFSMVSAAPMSDVAGTVYEEAVGRLSLLEVLTGYPDGSFKPENTITRAEFAAVAVRAKGLADAANAAKGLATGFTDVYTGHWASGYIATAGKLGVINGIGNGLFAPEAPVKYEDAVTMIVRALGYEAAAQTKGGYPYGYLIVANEIGLLDEVKGTQGAPASRGIVAQITGNALEIPMMIQVGFGSDTKWVVSGSKEHGTDAVEQYLLDSLGFDSVVGRVTSVSSKNKSITVSVEDEDEIDRLGKTKVSINVPAGFDVYEVKGVEAKFWYKDDVVIAKVQEEAKFDEFKFTVDELELTVEDEEYDIASSKNGFIEITIDGKDEDDLKKNDIANYGKVVLNNDDEVIWAEGYTFDGFIVVEKVEKEVALSYDDFDEVDLEDFTVVKDGKTIGIDGIQAEDVLFYNSDEEFAVVYNKGTEGQLDRVYVGGTFRFEGKGYEEADYASAVYLDDGKIGELTEEILDDLLDDEATIEVFVDFAGNVVLVKAEVSSVGNSAYGVLLDDVVVYDGRKGDMLALNLRNGANEKPEYDIEVADLLDKDIKLTNITVPELKNLKEDVVLKVSVDKDGDVTAIERPESIKAEKTFKTTASNVKGTDGYSYKLQSSTIVFYDNNKKATTIGDAKDVFKEINSGAEVYYSKGIAVAIVGETDADTDTKNVTGLVTGIKKVTGGKLQFTVEVFGDEQRFVTKSKALDIAAYDHYEDTIRTFEIGETSEEITDFPTTNQDVIKIAKRVGRVINDQVELNRNAVIFDAKLEEVSVNDLDKDDVITIYYQGSSNRFVDYVIIGGDLEDVDRTELDEVVAKADAKVKADYTAESWAKLQTALNLAQATQEQVDAKIIAIEEAIDGLVPAEVGEVKATYEASYNALAKKYVVRAKLNHASKTIEGFLIDGAEVEVKEVTGGWTYATGTFETEPSEIIVIVDAKEIPAAK